MPTLDSITLVSLAKQLNLVSVFSYVAPVLVCVWRWHSLPKAYRPLVLAGLVILWSLNILSEVGRQVWHNNILFLYLIPWAETLFLSWAYYQSFHPPRSRHLVLAGGLIFVLVALAEYLFGQGIYGSKTYTRAAQSVVLIGAALIYFEQILRELHNIRLERDPMFLVSVGVTLFYSGTLMVFVLEDSMHKLHQVNQIWMMFIIESILLIIFNIIVALALYWGSHAGKEVAQQEAF